MIHQWRLRSPRQVSISLWKVAGALVSLKGILLHTHKILVALLWTLSVAYFPHPFWPASIQTLGQGRRTTESLVGYQEFCLSGQCSMHPSQSSYWVSWGWYRTSGHHPFSRLGLLCWPTGLCDLWIVPISSISWIWALMSLYICGGMHL